MTVQAAPQPPEPVSHGVYALYETPDGGAVLSYRPDGSGEDLHQLIPAQIWKVLCAAARGEKIDTSPLALARLLMGR